MYFFFKENEELVKDKVNRSLFESIVKYGDLLINTKGEFVLNDGRIVALTLRPLNLNWAIFKVTDLTDLTISINKYTNVPAEWPEKITFNSATTTPLIRYIYFYYFLLHFNVIDYVMCPNLQPLLPK